MPEPLWPIRGQDRKSAKITNPYGAAQVRSSGFGGTLPPINYGVDAGAAEGTEIVAPLAGRVKQVLTTGGTNYGYGNSVVLDFGNGVELQLSHMQAPPNVKVGDTVAQGQLLGRVGKTGNATGPHLDNALRINGKPTNFLQLYDNPAGTPALAQLVQAPGGAPGGKTGLAAPMTTTNTTKPDPYAAQRTQYQAEVTRNQQAVQAAQAELDTLKQARERDTATAMGPPPQPGSPERTVWDAAAASMEAYVSPESPTSKAFAAAEKKVADAQKALDTASQNLADVQDRAAVDTGKVKDDIVSGSGGRFYQVGTDDQGNVTMTLIPTAGTTGDVRVVGDSLVDAEGNVLYTSPSKPGEGQRTVSPGETVLDASGKPIYTAPERPGEQEARAAQTAKAWQDVATGKAILQPTIDNLLATNKNLDARTATEQALRDPSVRAKLAEAGLTEARIKELDAMLPGALQQQAADVAYKQTQTEELRGTIEENKLKLQILQQARGEIEQATALPAGPQRDAALTAATEKYAALSDPSAALAYATNRATEQRERAKNLSAQTGYQYDPFTLQPVTGADGLPVMTEEALGRQRTRELDVEKAAGEYERGLRTARTQELAEATRAAPLHGPVRQAAMMAPLAGLVGPDQLRTIAGQMGIGGAVLEGVMSGWQGFEQKLQTQFAGLRERAGQAPPAPAVGQPSGQPTQQPQPTQPAPQPPTQQPVQPAAPAATPYGQLTTPEPVRPGEMTPAQTQAMGSSPLAHQITEEGRQKTPVPGREAVDLESEGRPGWARTYYQDGTSEDWQLSGGGGAGARGGGGGNGNGQVQTAVPPLEAPLFRLLRESGAGKKWPDPQGSAPSRQEARRIGRAQRPVAAVVGAA